MMAVPLVAMMGHSRQNTPMGDSFRISSMHFMKMSFRSLKAETTRAFFSPTRMMEKPMSTAMTMTCSILASTKGLKKLEGKMFTRVSIKEVASLASYARSVVAMTGNRPLNRLPPIRPMVTAKAVVHR